MNVGQFAFLFLIIPQLAWSLEVIGTIYHPEDDLLEVHITYVGGCIEHEFQMEITQCVLSKTNNTGFMNICDGQITDITQEHDSCTTTVTRTIIVPLHMIAEEQRPDLLGFNNSNVVLLVKRG